MSDNRTFPRPWRVEEYNDSCFIIKDATGFSVAYVYFDDVPSRRSATNRMSKASARRIANRIAKIGALDE